VLLKIVGDRMKKSIVIIIVLTLFSLTLFILVSNKTKTIDFKYNNTYIKVTSNYVDNSLYSTREETITLINGIINYKSIITYEDKNIKPITIEYINKYEEKDGYITTKNKTFLPLNSRNEKANAANEQVTICPKVIAEATTNEFSTYLSNGTVCIACLKLSNVGFCGKKFLLFV